MPGGGVGMGAVATLWVWEKRTRNAGSLNELTTRSNGILEFDGFRKFNHEDWVFQQQTYNIQHPVKQLQYIKIHDSIGLDGD